MTSKKKVVIGMSGGVDSSVAAYILKEQGYDVIGVTMQIWEKEDRCSVENNGGCCGASAIEDARNVADYLDIPYYVLNFRNDFKKSVIDYFIHEYMQGRTPNPCIACNRYVKWESLLKKSLQLGADYISTGHYSSIVQNPDNGRYALKVSMGEKKDQTYALFNLTQEQLKLTLMPIGSYSKEQIRNIAKEIGLDVANKPDSQEICFIPDNNYGSYLEKNINTDIKQGNFIDIKGNILGNHKGIIYYTVGQRKGLGLSFGKPMFVKEILPNTNEIILAEDAELYNYGLIANDINFMYLETVPDNYEVMAKIRYSHQPCKAKIKVIHDTIECIFSTAQRAITPGQAVVFYDNEGHVICGGTIKKVIM